MSMYTEEELKMELVNLLFNKDACIEVWHMPNHAGYQVQIGPFTMTISYDALQKPDPALARGWVYEVNDRGVCWRKGDLRVSSPKHLSLEHAAYPWHFGRASGPDCAWVIQGRCASRDVAMAAAEALP